MRIRTADLRIANALLYQLSYRPISRKVNAEIIASLEENDNRGTFTMTIF